jgi:hypothetical protein
MAVFFDQGDRLLKEVWVGQEENPNYDREAIKKYMYIKQTRS